MSKKLVIGIAAGVAACVVVGLLSRKTGLMENLTRKIKSLSDSGDPDYTDFGNVGMNDTIPRGEDRNVSHTLGK